MKKIYLTLVALFAITQFSHAQWNTSGNNIYNSNSGYIGIGTTSPNTLLDVNGIASFGNLSSLGTQLLVRGGTSGTSMLTLQRTSGAPAQFSFGLGGGGLSIVDQTNSAMVANMFGDNALNSLYIGQRTTITSESIARASLLSGLTVGPSLGSDLSVGNFIIQGNMGTGAGTPGDILFNTASKLVSGSTAQSSTTRLTIKHTTGNVGIGTTNPERLLTLGTSTPVIAVNTVDGNDNKFLKLTGGGQETNTRGAVIVLSGNEESTYFGDLIINAGASGITGHGLVRVGGTALIVDQLNARVGIGTASPDAALAVNGSIHTKEVKVDMSGWPDYVFEPSYKLPSLEVLKAYINKNQHLPEVPSAQEISKNGVNLGEMNKILIKKVEELTLYLIEQNKQLQDQQKINQSLQDQINALAKTTDPKK